MTCVPAEFFLDADWESEKFTRGQALIDLFILACSKPTKILIQGSEKEIPVGGISHTKKELSNRWKWSIGKLNRFFAELKAKNKIEYNSERNSGHNFSLVTICNYKEYCSKKEADGAQLGTQLGVQPCQTKEKQQLILVDNFSSPPPRARANNNIYIKSPKVDYVQEKKEKNQNLYPSFHDVQSASPPSHHSTRGDSTCIAGKVKSEIKNQALMEFDLEVEKQPAGVVETNDASVMPGRAPAALSQPKKEVRSEAWRHYQAAIAARYGAEPLRNARVNSQIKQLVERIGSDQLQEVIEYYVWSNNSYYLQRSHSVGALLTDCESISLQVRSGQSMTATKARQIDSRQAQEDNVQSAVEMYAQWDADL